jgi:hypothetical protein
MTRSFWAGVILGMSVIVAGSGLLLSAHAADEKPKGQGMLYELRTYYTPEGKLDAPTDKPNTLIYVIAHKDKAAADASWDAFRNDPEWKKVAEETQRNGKLVDKVESVYMHLTDYSPGK